MKAPVTYYIVAAISRVTSQQSYYNGYVAQITYSQYSIENKWTTERRFATRFTQYDLARKIADKFLNENNLMDFLVLEERD